MLTRLPHLSPRIDVYLHMSLFTLMATSLSVRFAGGRVDGQCVCDKFS